ncbi:uncharacterized protein OCT59_002168 [Rhizophagus irregularis]|uniref:BTB domain-containing protein n=1 Tax=Rhizophagus irregularis (strain DAOM 197198w) TaxID=1432141 RepID=A0A015LFW6_RHIIW|nr:hypothetical protein RirG_241500 [Rhizophagus irregularis DAOM 197198w]UZO10588.1 hypothetical protein OCT59_002168 [Rhizophagus irregularis]GBC47196.1 BTB/POZ protein [Rhizophagus irregularis DAOM 181602=DAOM 197198]
MNDKYLNLIEYETLIELLKDEVGEDPNVKIFRAHMNILCYRSPYLRRILSSNKKNNDNILAHIKLSNISPEIFQNILKYIYGGMIKILLKFWPLQITSIFKNLVDYLQKYLIKNKSDLAEQHFGIIQQIYSQSNNLLELQEFCTKIFKSFNFTALSEKSLISLIKNNELQMKEIEVCEYVLKWGLAQNSTLILDPKTWSDDDFKTMKNILQSCLLLIRFFGLSSREFSQKVRPKT